MALVYDSFMKAKQAFCSGMTRGQVQQQTVAEFSPVTPSHTHKPQLTYIFLINPKVFQMTF